MTDQELKTKEAKDNIDQYHRAANEFVDIVNSVPHANPSPQWEITILSCISNVVKSNTEVIKLFTDKYLDK